MNWIVVAMLSHFVWSIGSIGEKYVVDKRIKNGNIYAIFWSLGLVSYLFLIPFIGFYVPELKDLLIIIVASIFYLVGIFPYIWALKVEEISRINMWWSLLPVITLFLAWFFIGDKLTGIQLLAMLILLIGSIVASIHPKQGGVSFSKAMLFMVLSCLCYAVHAVMIRYVTRAVPVEITFVWKSITGVLFGMFLLAFSNLRRDFISTIKLNRSKGVILIFFITLVAYLGAFLNYLALSLGPAALVYSFEGFQAVSTFILVIFISLFIPSIVKEELDKKNIILKVVALILIIVGVLVLNLG